MTTQQEAVAALRDGATDAELRTLFGVQPSKVRYWAKHHHPNCPRDGRLLDPTKPCGLCELDRQERHDRKLAWQREAATA